MASILHLLFMPGFWLQSHKW